MNSTPPGLRGRSLAFLSPLGVALIGALAMATGKVQAQTNLGNVAPAVLAYCNATDGIGCDSQSPPVNLAQIAPDRFVTQGYAALELVTQRFSTVHRRLRERMAASTGAVQVATPQAPWAGVRIASLSSPFELFAQSDLPATSEAGTSSGPVRAPEHGFYVHAEGGDNHVRPTAFDRGFDLRATSLVLGGDFAPSSSTLLGLSYNHDDARTSLDTSDGGQPGSMNLRGDGVALYGAWYPMPAAYVDATLLWGRNRYATTRRFHFELSDIQDTTSGSTTGHQQGLSLGAGYDFKQGRASVGPYARIDYARITIAGFTEVGGTDVNGPGQPNDLVVQEQRFTSLTSRLGAQASMSSSTDWGVVVPYAMLEWVHQFRRDRSESLIARMAFLAANADSMTIATTPVDRNYANLGLGLAAHLGIGRSLALYYQRELARAGQRAQQLTAELRLEF
jgi:outer membrane autotransporter protein